jgi:16S rRNA (cytosine1402-N4)-methyltransferase
VSALVHKTVLLDETLRAVAPKSGGVYADATVGFGGHTEGVLQASSPDGRVIGLDRDQIALASAKERLATFGDRVALVHARFSELREVLQANGYEHVDGVIADVGVSSPQLDEAERGFSFARSGPLDMRMDRSSGETALELIERLDEEELANIIFKYGEERKSRGIARSIKRALSDGEIASTDDLRRAIVRSAGPRRAGNVDPATRTFQALRIAVNHEIEELEALVASLPDLLADGGVAAIISFHSLEDRVVKYAFRDDVRMEPLTKKPVIAGEEESTLNPRSRSAKLRAARRVPREVAP